MASGQHAPFGAEYLSANAETGKKGFGGITKRAGKVQLTIVAPGANYFSKADVYSIAVVRADRSPWCTADTLFLLSASQ